MDKYEYKIRSEEIKELIAQKEYVEAAEIADTIDWRRVKSVMMLCTISDLYKMNRRYEDSRNLLLLAYDRHPGGRSIVYSLCELSIKMGDFVMAVEYYKEFVQIAPKDSGRYILQYKLYEAQDVSLEERIAVLEELKARDYTEKWAYELAYLYHRVGLGTKCVEECDDLVLWFGEGKYVVKAMELKMLHDPLTPDQQMKYEYLRNLARVESEEAAEPQSKASAAATIETAPTQILPSMVPTQELPTKEVEIQVKQVGVGQYDTINIQKELAENMRELWIGSEDKPVTRMDVMEAETKVLSESMLDQTDNIGVTEEMLNQELPPEEPTMKEVFFGETEELDDTADQVMEVMRSQARGEAVPEPILYEQGVFSDEMKEVQFTVNEDTQELVMVETPSASGTLDRMLGMEYDGQISFVLPESEQIEKQITGQIRLEDVLLEWERMKKDSEEKHKEALRQRVKEQTGAMFTEFEAAVRDGLLEQLESGKLSAEDLEQKVDDALEEESVLKAERFVEEVMLETPEEEIDEVEELEEIQEVVFEDFVTEEDEALQEVQEMPEEQAQECPEEYPEEFSEEYSEETYEAEDDQGEMVAEYADYVEEEYEYTDEAYEEFPEEYVEEPEDISDEEIEELEEETEESEEVVVEEEAEETEEEPAEEEAEETEEEPAEEEAEETEEEPAEEEAEEAEEESAEEETEETQKEAAEEPASGKKAPSSKGKARPFSPEEEELFGTFAHNEIMRERIVTAIDTISMASYTGNVIITGDEGMDTLALAKSLVKEIQNTDSNFSGKTAKISGGSLNKKDIAETLDKLANGALIVQSACAMTNVTAQKLHRALEQEERGIIVILIDGKKTMNRFLKNNSMLKETFTVRVDIAAMDNDALVKHGVEYAREQEYSIDDLGVLALHTRIAEMQTSDHAVNINEVKEIVDDAIRHANRKTLGHFFDIIVAKRYDDEDMIILREKDFI